MINSAAVPPWEPNDLPTLRAAYSDRTAALMAYLASFAYRKDVESRGLSTYRQISLAWALNVSRYFTTILRTAGPL